MFLAEHVKPSTQGPNGQGENPELRPPPTTSCPRHLLQLVSKIGSASHQVLMCAAGKLVSFCHEEAAEAVDG